jgi:hypothetical protein
MPRPGPLVGCGILRPRRGSTCNQSVTIGNLVCVHFGQVPAAFSGLFTGPAILGFSRPQRSEWLDIGLSPRCAALR